MAMFESHMLKGASNVSITNSSLNIGPSAKQLAYEKLSVAAVHSALHNAPARTDNTRCHKNTRVKILDKLERWARGTFTEEASIFWLYGGAGAGKSAIMQTLSERCAEQELALGSFFFSRSDPTRNDAMVLIPTLAYQVVQIFPDALQVLHPLINRDTLIFKKSLQVQLMELLVRPLQHLVQLGKIGDASKSPQVFLIDGLDECDNPDQQQEIIRAVAAVCHEHHIPVKFLIASRPELSISTSFRSYKQSNRSLGSISLSEDPDAETDIRQFTEDEFVKICLHHPFNEHIPSEWPHGKDISMLVQKSSCHFIYTSTAMKYIWSAKENPVRSLQVILGLEVSRAGSPFAELDALFHHIFQSVGHLDKILQILAHCLFSDLPSVVNTICIMHEYSPSDFHIFMADTTPLIYTPPRSRDLDTFVGTEVKFLHASLGDFLCDPTRSGTLYLDRHLYLASQFERCIQLVDIYSQGQTTEPMWSSPSRPDDEQYRTLHLQISKTINLCGHLDAVRDVLSGVSLSHLYECARRMSYPFYEGCFRWVSTILVAICAFETPTSFSKRYMEEFLDILESPTNPRSMPLASIMLPLIFLGYPIHELHAISRDTPFDALLRITFSQPADTTLLDKVVTCIASSDPSICHQRAILSPGQLAATIEVILDYLATEWAESDYPDRESRLICTNRKEIVNLSNALMWLLPKAGFTEKIVIFSQRVSHRCERDSCSKLKKRLDEYNIRVRDESLNLGKNTSQYLPLSNPELPRPVSVPRMRAQERESELRTPSLRGADASDNDNSSEEGNNKTRTRGRAVQKSLHAAVGTDTLGSASQYDSAPSRPGSSLSESWHGAGRSLGYDFDDPQSVVLEPGPEVECLGPQPNRESGDTGLLDLERNRDSPASKNGDGNRSTQRVMSTPRDHSGSRTDPSPVTGHTTRDGASRYNPEYDPRSSQVGHSEVGAVTGASSPRVDSMPFPRASPRNTQHSQDHYEISDTLTSTAPDDSPETFGYLTHEGEREREEVRALKEQHALELKALLSRLEDAQRTVNILREENERLWKKNGQLREENGQLRGGLDRVMDIMRDMEGLKQACATPEVEKSHLLSSNTRD